MANVDTKLAECFETNFESQLKQDDVDLETLRSQAGQPKAPEPLNPLSQLTAMV